MKFLRIHCSCEMVLLLLLLRRGLSTSSASPITPRVVRSLSPSPKKVFFFRDDLLQLGPNPHHAPSSAVPSLRALSGNKARKFYSLYQRLQQSPSIHPSLPPSIPPLPRVIKSYGGAQSNAMLALASLASWSPTPCSFVYYTRKLPAFLAAAPNGNLKAALACGMQLQELDSEDYDKLVSSTHHSIHPSIPPSLPPSLPPLHKEGEEELWVRQGGSLDLAKAGADALASEMLSFVEAQAAKGPQRRVWKVTHARTHTNTHTHTHSLTHTQTDRLCKRHWHHSSLRSPRPLRPPQGPSRPQRPCPTRHLRRGSALPRHGS